jgi:hypothetical protein
MRLLTSPRVPRHMRSRNKVGLKIAGEWKIGMVQKGFHSCLRKSLNLQGRNSFLRVVHRLQVSGHGLLAGRSILGLDVKRRGQSFHIWFPRRLRCPQV